MARTIWKYTLDLAAPGTCEVRMPKGARCLSVGLQLGDKPSFVLWADVDPAEPLGYTFVRSCVTGDATPTAPRWRFLNTVQVMSSNEPPHTRRMLVWHFFVAVEPESAA